MVLGLVLNKTANCYAPVRTSAELSGNAVRATRVMPPPDLAAVVMDFWQYEVDPALDYIPIQVFPSGCVVLRFNIRPDHVESVLYGPSLRNSMKGVFYHDWSIFGIALRPERAYQLLGLSLYELRNIRIHLDCFWPQPVRVLEQQLQETTNFGQRITLMVNFLRQVLRTDVSPKAEFLNAFHDIVRLAPSAEDIGYIAKRNGTSSRNLRRSFYKYLGIGPKQAERLFRVQNSMSEICQKPNSKLALVAQTNGFSDQAHFSREFSSLTGYTPGRFAALIGSMHEKSLPAWNTTDTSWRFKRSPKIMRFE